MTSIIQLENQLSHLREIKGEFVEMWKLCKKEQWYKVKTYSQQEWMECNRDLQRARRQYNKLYKRIYNLK
jgi:hypothetical protein